MKLRVISGILYSILLVAFFALKIFIHDFCFDVLIYAYAIIGTFEIVRALKDKMTKAERILVYVFTILCIPMCTLAEYFFRYGLHVTSVCFSFMGAGLLSLLVLRHEETTPENLGVTLFATVYPVLLLSVMVLANHVNDPVAIQQGKYPKILEEASFNSDVLILLIFTVSNVSDCVAYFFGRFFHKQFPEKMAPAISPNKTIIGGIGGIIGGIIGALIVYFAYNAFMGMNFVNMNIWLPIYIGIGGIAAAATEFGDLVESCIKRKLGVKDLGNLIPGHGGVLDRIDGTMFASLAVYLCFAFIRLLVS